MLQILGSEAFLGPLRDAAAAGESVLFRGKVEVDGEASRCYIKPFPPLTKQASGAPAENRSVISEALGYILAKSCGFSVARTAGIIILRQDQIPTAALEKLAAQSPSGDAEPEYLAWFSEDMRLSPLIVECPSDAPELVRQRNLSRVASDLANHKKSPGIASFDEWIENSDRHLGNLLGSSDGDLILIDHGRIFRTPAWSPGDLESSPLHLRNALMDLIDSFTPNWSERSPIRSARILAYKTFSVAWHKDGKSLAGGALSEFMAHSEVEQVLEFLSARLEPGYYTAKVGLIA